ncbi:MAG: IS481 family transposase [Anaerolineae bacterium]|nr:IS481 family transposase [Anaerolineae bacterium]
MPWQEQSMMSLRREFVQLARQEGVNLSALCQRFGISRKTAYKWLARSAAGDVRLADHSRRPHSTPQQTSAAVEAVLVAARRAHPAWGARKLGAWAVAQGQLDPSLLPAPSTITAILRRRGLLDPTETAKHTASQRFEHDAPNRLWQMDFKGDFALKASTTTRCYPLSVLDDHSRFALGLQPCADQQATTVQRELTAIFRRYGLPERMTMDNGAPWGSDAQHPYTVLTVWLLRLGIRISHSRPYHPQTQGKDERFHRTFQAEVLRYHTFATLADCQPVFEAWRQMYNLERPHAALELAVPASRYQPSPRAFPDSLPAIEYGPDDIVRRVQANGEISYHRRVLIVGRAFYGYPVALRPTATDGHVAVYFCQHKVAELDLRLAEVTP